MPSADRVIAPVPDVPLAPLSTLGVGGAARWFVRADTVETVAAAHRWSAAHGTSLLVLGGGSNVVIDDAGFDGLVLQVDLRGVEFTDRGGETIVRAGAGEHWDPIVAASVARGLAGLECLSGIPGRAGGTPIQNVGAYAQEVAQAIDSVAVYDTSIGAMATLPANACGFAYRTSRFKQADAGRFIVCGVTFRLRPGLATVAYPDVRARLREEGVTAPSLEQVRDAVLRIRRRKGMVIDPADPDTRSVGSFFTNPVVTRERFEQIAVAAGQSPPSFAAGQDHVKVPAAWLIERAGFQKGHRDGAAGISSKHPLALVNRGGATARDIVRLASRIALEVANRFEVRLRPEPVLVGFEHDPNARYLLEAPAPSPANPES